MIFSLWHSCSSSFEEHKEKRLRRKRQKKVYLSLSLRRSFLHRQKLAKKNNFFKSFEAHPAWRRRFEDKPFTPLKPQQNSAQDMWKTFFFLYMKFCILAYNPYLPTTRVAEQETLTSTLHFDLLDLVMWCRILFFLFWKGFEGFLNLKFDGWFRGVFIIVSGELKVDSWKVCVLGCFPHSL